MKINYSTMARVQEDRFREEKMNYNRGGWYRLIPNHPL